MLPATVTVYSARSLPLALDAVNWTWYEPAAVKVWVGLLTVEVPPSPKTQDQDVGVFVDVSVNWTDCPGAGFDGLEAKLATGASPPPTARVTL